MAITIEQIKRFAQQELNRLTDDELSMLNGIVEHGAASEHRAAYKAHVDAVLEAATRARAALEEP